MEIELQVRLQKVNYPLILLFNNFYLLTLSLNNIQYNLLELDLVGSCLPLDQVVLDNLTLKDLSRKIVIGERDK
jgi:hypothetical protein